MTKSNLIEVKEGLEATRVLAAAKTVKEMKRQLIMASTQLQNEHVPLWTLKRGQASLNFHCSSHQLHLVK